MKRLQEFRNPETKGDLMKLIFTKEEQRNVDVAIPIQYWQEVPWYTVMDYNPPHGLGKLVDMLELAYERGITIACKLPQFQVVDDEFNQRYYELMIGTRCHTPPSYAHVRQIWS